MKLRIAALLVAALAPALHSHSVHAATHAEASVSIVKIELIDLDPNDGITPSLQLLTDLPWYQLPNASIDMKTVSGIGNLQLQQIQRQPWQPLTLERSADGVIDASTAIGGTSLATRSVSAAFSASETSDIFYGSAGAKGSLDFILSPNSSVTVTFELSVAAAAGGGNMATASAGASLIDEIGPRGSAIGPRLLLEHRDYGGARPDQGAATSRQFTGTLTSNAEPNQFTLGLSVGTSVSPVPEPATWGMLLAGLGLVGAAGRRARKQRGA